MLLFVGSGALGHDRTVAEPSGRIEELTGRLLVGLPPLGDPNFDRSIVLLLDHSPAGGLGIVINRPTGVPVDEILPAWHTAATSAPPAVVFAGGPVSPGALIGLARPALGEPALPEGWREVLSGVGTIDLSVSPELHPVAIDAARLFAGYAGWSPSQLEGEIEAGAWLAVEADPSDVFCSEPSLLWHDILRRQGGDTAMLAAYPPHPSVN